MHKFAEKIMECVKSKIEARGIDNVSYDEVKELGEWVDIAKDIVCYDKDMREIEQMDEEEKYGEMDYRMGYRGRDSKGRFVHRSGRGRSAGYTPYVHMMPPFMDGMYDEYDGMMPEDYRMGYSNSGSRSGNSGGGRSGGSGNYGGSGNSNGQGNNSGSYGYSEGNRGGSRRGETYDRYRDNRRHYTDTKDLESKKKMDESMKEYMDDAMDSMKEMWKDADPQLKQSMKAELTKLVQQLQ